MCARTQCGGGGGWAPPPELESAMLCCVKRRGSGRRRWCHFCCCCGCCCWCNLDWRNLCLGCCRGLAVMCVHEAAARFACIGVDVAAPVGVVVGGVEARPAWFSLMVFTMASLCSSFLVQNTKHSASQPAAETAAEAATAADAAAEAATDAEKGDSGVSWGRRCDPSSVVSLPLPAPWLTRTWPSGMWPRSWYGRRG